MEDIGGYRHPGRKTGKKKAARKGKAAHRKDRDLKRDEASTSSNETSKGTPEGPLDEDIFYDAAAMEIEPLGYRCTDAAPSVGSPRTPKKDVSRTERGENSGVPEIQQAPSTTKSYWLKHYSHSTRHSIAIQTVDDDEINRRDLQSFKGDDKHFRSSDVYEDARETLTDHEFPLAQEKDHRRKRQNTKTERVEIQQLGSKDACRFKNENVDSCQWMTTDHQEEAVDHPSCCYCMLTVLFWLSVVMFILLLLTLFFVVFLLFSRNHGLGIGPYLIYSDVDLVRSAVNPSLDLRHNGPPPT